MRSTNSPLFKRLILHIGSHKTGTSAVQRAANDQSDALLDQGVLYPKVGQWHDKSHHKWAFAIWDTEHGEEKISELLDDLYAEKKAHHKPIDTVLLSSEIIEKSALDPNLIGTLSFLLRGIAEEVECVFFTRRQDLLLESVFKQWVKDHGTRLAVPFDRFARNQKAKMDYLEVAESWEALPNVSKVIIRTNALSEDPKAAFFAAANLNLPALKDAPNKIVNPTLDGVRLELKYFLNNLDLTKDQDYTLLSLIHNIEAEKETLSLFSDEGRRKLIEEFRPVNERLVEKYGVDPFLEDIPSRSREMMALNGRALHGLLEQLFDQDKRFTWQLFNKMRQKVQIN